MLPPARRENLPLASIRNRILITGPIMWRALSRRQALAQEDIIQISFWLWPVYRRAGPAFWVGEGRGHGHSGVFRQFGEKQLMMLRDFGVTGLVATPSLCAVFGESWCRRAAIRREAYAKLRHGILGSEGCTEQMRGAYRGNSGEYGLQTITA